jgi:hypothetical protein
MNTIGRSKHLESFCITAALPDHEPLVSLLEALESNPESRLSSLQLLCTTADVDSGKYTRLFIACKVKRFANSAHLDPTVLRLSESGLWGPETLHIKELFLYNCLDSNNCEPMMRFLGRRGRELSSFLLCVCDYILDLEEQESLLAALGNMARLDRLSISCQGGVFDSLVLVPNVEHLEINDQRYIPWNQIPNFVHRWFCGDGHPARLKTLKLDRFDAFPNVNWTIPRPSCAHRDQSMLTLKEFCLKEREDARSLSKRRALALACGAHPRLGADSPMQMMSQYLLGEIFGGLGLIPCVLDVKLTGDAGPGEVPGMINLATWHSEFPPNKRAKFS